ncbi:hypothetical protein B7P43_G11925, partial [Cryptotermes secundus]
SGNACYHSVQNLLSSRLLSKNTKIIIYKTINLPVVLYRCEICSLPLREEHRMRVLRRIFGPKRYEVTGGWRKEHNEELHNLRMRWAGHVARMGERRNAYKTLVGKSEGRRPLGRPRRRWMDNIKMDLREIEWNGMGWIDLAEDRDQRRALVNMVINLWVP